MHQYATLVDDAALSKHYMKLIVQEFERTRGMLETLYGHGLAERRPRMYKMIGFRSQRLWPLHMIQVEQLRTWRKLKTQGQEEQADAMLSDMLLVLNAIAGGLGTTG
jgi:phosphoenolpyruvate carboxylase